MIEQTPLALKRPPSQEKDIFLCHTGADKQWVEMLAERIESQPYRDRKLSVVFDKWDFDKAGNIVLDMERYLDAARFIGVVVSRAALSAEWPTLERTIAVWSDPSGARRRVIPLLIENVTLPATLRVRNWIDFRDSRKFDESFAELIRCLRGTPIARGKGSLLPNVPAAPPPYEPAPAVITSSVEADRITERLVSNLYRITEIPERVYFAPTKLRNKKEIHEYSETCPPFILHDKKLYTFANLSESEVFQLVLTANAQVRSDSFKDWFSDEDYSHRAIELLNVTLKDHAWKCRLRFDGTKARYFASPRAGKPVRIAWKIGGRTYRREVTTRHTRRMVREDGGYKDEPFGWRHQAFRARFILMMDSLMVKLEPTYLLTNEDGKTPRTSRWVGPILSKWINQERNGQILRSLRFWSLVLAQGKELIIETGQKPIRVDLTPVSGPLAFGIAGDQMDFDRLMAAEIEDDAGVPQVELFGREESSIAYKEEDQIAEEGTEDEET